MTRILALGAATFGGAFALVLVAALFGVGDLSGGELAGAGVVVAVSAVVLLLWGGSIDREA